MKKIIVLLLFLVFLLSGCASYCETTFEDGTIKLCKFGSCHLGGCNFICEDGSKIDTSRYTRIC